MKAPRLPQNQPADPAKLTPEYQASRAAQSAKDRQGVIDAQTQRKIWLEKLASQGVRVSKPTGWRLEQLAFMHRIIQEKTRAVPCDSCDVLRLQLAEARSELQRLKASSASADFYQMYRILHLADLSGLSVLSLLVACNTQALLFKKDYADSLAVVAELQGYIWSDRQAKYIKMEANQ